MQSPHESPLVIVKFMWFLVMVGTLDTKNGFQSSHSGKWCFIYWLINAIIIALQDCFFFRSISHRSCLVYSLCFTYLLGGKQACVFFVVVNHKFLWNWSVKILCWGSSALPFGVPASSITVLLHTHVYGDGAEGLQASCLTNVSASARIA